jgi:hypothetical protein
VNSYSDALARMHEAELGALFAGFPQAGLLTAASPEALAARVPIPKSPSALAEISAIYQLAATSMYQPRQTRGVEQVRLKSSLCMFKAKFINPENFDF